MIQTYSIDYRTATLRIFSLALSNHIKPTFPHGNSQMESLSIVTSLLLITGNVAKLSRSTSRKPGQHAPALSGKTEQLSGSFCSVSRMTEPDLMGVISDLSVDPAYRGKRIGQELLQERRKVFRDKGIQDCYSNRSQQPFCPSILSDITAFKQVPIFSG